MSRSRKRAEAKRPGGQPTCPVTGKVRYFNRESAIRARQHVQRGFDLEPYPCREAGCDGWHLGNKTRR